MHFVCKYKRAYIIHVHICISCLFLKAWAYHYTIFTGFYGLIMMNCGVKIFSFFFTTHGVYCLAKLRMKS